MLVMSAMLGSRNDNAKKLAIPAMAATGVALLCALLFVLLKPEALEAQGMKVGYSVYLFFPAALAGLRAAYRGRNALDYEDTPKEGYY